MRPPLCPTPVCWRLVPCVFALLLGVAAAQALELAPLRPAAGEHVTVTGRGLPPGGQATARLTAPGGRVSRQSAGIGDAGRFSLDIAIPTGGRYQLYVRGPGVERTWELDVPRPAPPPPDGAASPTEPRRPNPAPGRAASAGAGAPPAGGQSLTQAAPRPAGRLEVRRVGPGLRGTRGERTLWTLSFPEGSGRTTQPLLLATTPPRLYAGHGSSVLRLDPETGTVRERLPVSGPVERLQADGDAVAITVRHSDTLSERFTLRGGAVQEPVRFGLDPRIYGYLRAEAKVPDPAARTAQDPTNPWLHLRAGLAAADPAAARTAFAEAVRRGGTFYDLAGVATVLEAEGERGLAEGAFDAALRDFAARGYDPRLLTDGGLEARYNFPLTPLRRALAAGDDLRAGFWAERLLLAAPYAPGAQAAFAEYAALLERVGTPEAATWRTRAASLTPAAPPGAQPDLTRSAWGISAALLAAFAALHLTLLAKYLYARRLDREGGRAPWLFALRYGSLSEKLVLLALLAAALACAALASWSSGRPPLPARLLGSGTLANREAQAYLDGAALSGQAGALVRGAAQLSAGDRDAATASYRAAGAFAPALNNLGVLTGDAGLYRRALGLEPTLDAARYNTGDRAALPFQARYRPDAPALALPTPGDLRTALLGSPQSALTEPFRNPQAAFQGPPPVGLGTAPWRGLQLILGVVALFHVVALFVPRPRSTYRVSRPRAYTVLALLFPGTGLADEAWGIFLLVPWAAAGAAALSQALGWGLFPPLSSPLLYLVLGGVYALNAVAVAVEGMSRRSRVQAANPSLRRRA